MTEERRTRRICLVIPDLGPGGAQRVLCALANCWAEQGCSVTLITYENPKSRPFFDLANSVQIRRLNVLSQSTSSVQAALSNLRRVYLLRREIRAVSADLVISFLDVMNVVTLLATMGHGVPVVVCERTDPLHAPLPTVWRLGRRLTYHLARIVVVQTSRIAQFFRPWVGDRVVVIPNPLLPPEMTREVGTVCRLQSTILSIGRLSEEKRFDLLLLAFERLALRFPDWTLVIVGEGPLRNDLERLRDELGLLHRVKFFGLVQEIAAIYRGADIFVLCSRYEGFPNALCEAMSYGLPVISTNCSSSISEIVDHGHNGLIVANEMVEPLADALARLIEDEPYRRHLGMNATAISKRYSMESIIAKWDSIFFECEKMPRYN